MIRRTGRVTVRGRCARNPMNAHRSIEPCPSR